MTTAVEPVLGAMMINCRRYVAMISWYRELMEAETLHRDAIQCWLRSPQGWTLQLLDSQLADRPREVAGVDGLALQYVSFEALAKAFLRLGERDIYPERALKNGFVTSLMYRDPDGNRLALRHLLPTDSRGQGPYGLIGDEFTPSEMFAESLSS